MPGAIYHLTARGNGGAPIFDDDYDRIYLLDLLARATQRFAWRILAYCLMDNHYHLLVQTAEPTLSDGMRHIQTRYARRFNTRHRRSGHLFGDRFHDTRIEADSHLVAAAVYMVRNPVRAGVVDTPGAWPWSSYRSTVGGGERRGFLSDGTLLALLSPDPARARELFRELAEAGDRRV